MSWPKQIAIALLFWGSLVWAYGSHVGVPVYNDLTFMLLSGKLAGSSNPTLTTLTDGLQVYAFSASATNEVFGSQQLPHGYKYESTLDAHCHVGSVGVDTGDAAVCMEYSLAEIGSAFPSSTTICGIVTGPGSAGTHTYVDIGDISGTGIDSLSAMIHFRVFRDHDHASDDLTDALFIHQCDFHIQEDTLGSIQELVKFL